MIITQQKNNESLVKSNATEDIETIDEEDKKFKPIQAYFVLFLVLMCRIMVQWHRKGLTYAYGYTGLGAAAGDAFYEIAASYP